MAAPDHGQFQQILMQAMRPEKELRDAAEAHIKAWLADADWMCGNLVQAMSAEHSPEQAVRQMAAVLFRRYSFFMTEPSLSLWPRASPEAKEQVKAVLLQSLVTEPDEGVRHKIADAISVLAQCLTTEESAQEIEAAGGHVWYVFSPVVFI